MRTIALLIASNVFMTMAWYGHLRFKDVSLWKVILVSWGIAFVEYCLQVPANRWGHGTFSAFQLKLMQEVITLVVFVVFAVLWLKETPKWNHAVAALFLVGAVVFAFWESVPSNKPSVDVTTQL
ncbi:MAG: DMT family protein [Deltaproteobacteria bacterium]|nr:DMT family protein [Deltaproteobacteria bacterium]